MTSVILVSLACAFSLDDTWRRGPCGSGNVRIDWTSNGNVFQLERADEPGGPYVPVGPITTDTEYIDLVAVLGTAKSFYRVRLW